MCVFIAASLLIGGGAGEANAATCTGKLTPVGDGTSGPGDGGAAPEFEGVSQDKTFQIRIPLTPQGEQTLPRWSAAQVRNAATITNVARTRNLAPRAAVIAVAVAMQESSLNNLSGGHADSVGLFQQRPSQGWGTVSQLTDPVYASKKFYDSLVKVSDWQTKPLTKVAAGIQRPAEALRGEYAKWEQSAGSLVADAWGDHAVTSEFAGCDTDTSSTSQTAVSGAVDPVTKLSWKAPRSPAQAIQAARKANGMSGWYRLCELFVEQAYGTRAVHASANVGWQAAVSGGYAHPGDSRPPPGALLYYDTGEKAGHVALYLGRDQVASNDIVTNGQISIVSRKELTDGRWRLRYRGWAEPRFPAHPGPNRI
ncbi:M23 family metallopeptidase [Streptomyces sp. NPDC003011]